METKALHKLWLELSSLGLAGYIIITVNWGLTALFCSFMTSVVCIVGNQFGTEYKKQIKQEKIDKLHA